MKMVMIRVHEHFFKKQMPSHRQNQRLLLRTVTEEESKAQIDAFGHRLTVLRQVDKRYCQIVRSPFPHLTNSGGGGGCHRRVGGGVVRSTKKAL